MPPRAFFGERPSYGRLRGSVGDLRQLACVRRIVLDDGPERGVRALAFSTGGGLDFWVLSDRSFDIGPMWFGGMPIAWQGPNGFRNPALHDAADDEGQGFERSFSGLLVTCGLDHVRQPRNGRPLHGRLPFTPGRLRAYGEDWEREVPILFCQGEVTQARIGGEALRLYRRIEAPIGGTSLVIEDRVENLSAEPQAHEILYHFNLGFPAIRESTHVLLGKNKLIDSLPLPAPKGETKVRCVHVEEAEEARCVVRTPLGDGNNLEIVFGFSTSTLPFVQIWENLRANEYVLGVEPCNTNRGLDGATDGVVPLAPGATRDYKLAVSVAQTA